MKSIVRVVAYLTIALIGYVIWKGIGGIAGLLVALLLHDRIEQIINDILLTSSNSNHADELHVKT